jgi:hypothetical protein
MAPKIARGTDVQFEITAFYGDPNAASPGLLNMTNIAAISIDVKDSASRATAILAAKYISAANINSSLLVAEWEDGAEAHCHVAASYLNSETSPDLAGSLREVYWLVVSATTTDSPPHRFMLGSANLTIEEDGHGTGDTPAPAPPASYSQEQSAALFLKKKTAPGEAVLFVNADRNGGVQVSCGTDAQGNYILKVSEIRY